MYTQTKQVVGFQCVRDLSVNVKSSAQLTARQELEFSQKKKTEPQKQHLCWRVVRRCRSQLGHA